MNLNQKWSPGLSVRTVMMSAAAVAVASCSVSCEGLSFSLSPDGKFSVTGTVPPAKGKVVEPGGK